MHAPGQTFGMNGQFYSVFNGMVETVYGHSLPSQK